MKRIFVGLITGLLISGVLISAHPKNRIDVLFETDYDNTAIMHSDEKEIGDYIVEFVNINGIKSSVGYDKIDGERVSIPVDTVDLKVYKIDN